MRIFCPAMARCALFLVDPVLLGAGTLRAWGARPPTPEVGRVAPYGTVRARHLPVPSREDRQPGVRRGRWATAPWHSLQAAAQGSTPAEQPEQFARRTAHLTNPVERGPGQGVRAGIGPPAGAGAPAEGPSDHLRILVTRPAPTVRPPSRMAKRRPSSIAMGWIISTRISVLSPGMTISVPSGRCTTPVTSVVRK